ncbi:MAG: hypothetical protein AB1921_09195 [Thermodesulfobacteriota bacterium]
MKKYVLDQLREKASVPGKQKTWISLLDDEQRYTLFLMLRNGESSKAIARHAQDAWGVLPGSSVHSISQGVTKFKKRIAHLLLIPGQEEAPRLPAEPSPGQELPEGSEGLDILAERHKRRIYKMMAEEEKTGVKYPHLNREIMALSQLVKSIAKQKDWEIKNGGRDPVKLRREEAQMRQMKEDFDGFVNQLGDDRRDVLIRATQTFLKKIKEKALPLYKDENGEWTNVPPNGG